MTVQRNMALTNLNTLGIAAKASYFAEVTSLDALATLLADTKLTSLPRLVLGGGSNIVLQQDFAGLVIKIALRGVQCEALGESRLLRVAAGENWDALVKSCLQQGWYGLENLISIPGSVGAAPIQNIGAYGVELSDVLVAVSGWDLRENCLRRLSASDCELSYRSSIFKTHLLDQFIVTEVELKLSHSPSPNIRYQALADALPSGVDVTPELVAETVARLRASKLPDFRLEPNAGSFFKNPIIEASNAAELQAEHPQLVSWPMPDGRVKLAAAWLVDQCGWKGQRVDGVGVHPRQAIVLVNYEHCSGGNVLALAAAIQEAVSQRFGVALEIEPRIY